MQILPFFGYSVYQMFLMFCFWSFVGWCIEVVDMTVETGEYQNRGFLNMPICPIEGFGVIMVSVFFRPINDTIIPLFLACTALCTGFELFVGWGMEKLFHARWWDYSHMKFNYKGFICLRNSLFFGGGCVICLRYIQPTVEKAINALPVKIGLVIVTVMGILIAVDTCVSLMAVKKLNERIRRIDEISKIMLSGSVMVGMKLASGTQKVMSNVDKLKDATGTVVEKVQDTKDTVAEKLHDTKDTVAEKMRGAKDSMTEKARSAKENVQTLNAASLEKLKREYSRLVNERDAATERLTKALISHSSMDSLRLIKGKLQGKVSKIIFLGENGEEEEEPEQDGEE